VKADPRLVGQVDHPIGPEYRRELAEHARQTPGWHDRHILDDHLAPGDLGPVDGHDWHHHHVGVGQDLGGLVRLEVNRAQRGGEG
jgi:hypothetical protein